MTDNSGRKSTLSHFIPARIPKGSRCLILGSPRYGKTSLVKTLIKRANLRNGSVITGFPSEWGLDSAVSLCTSRTDERFIKRQLSKYRKSEKKHFVVLEADLWMTDYNKIYDHLFLEDRENTAEPTTFVVRQTVPEKPLLEMDFDYIFLGRITSETVLAKTKLFIGPYWFLHSLVYYDQSLDDHLKGLEPYEFLVIDRHNKDLKLAKGDR